MTPTPPEPTAIREARKHLAEGRLAEADAGFRAAIAADPNCAEAIEGIGEVAMERGAFAAAAEFFDIALTIKPGLVNARVTLGLAQLRLGRGDLALVNFKRAVEDGPTHPLAHYWLGHRLLEMGELKAGMAAVGRALELWPDLVSRMSLSQFERLQACDWSGWEPMREFLEKAALEGRGFSDPMTLMMMSQSPKVILAAAKSYGRNYPTLKPLRAAPREPGPRIRLAFLSADFHDHPVAHLIAGVIETFDRERFELAAFSYGKPYDNAIRRRVEAAFETFNNVHGEDAYVMAQKIDAFGADIAISMNGYTREANPFILSHRPAPVQVSFQGYPGTLGVDYMDYLIADRHVIPRGEERFYVEQVVRLPHTYQPTDNKAAISKTPPSRAKEGLPETAFVFMGYNAHHKISPIIFDVWMRILQRVPGSVLWLQGRKPKPIENLRREAAARGVDPNRLIFAAVAAERGDHIARHRLADLFLDTLPYNAHSTASDALWGGVPIVSCRGTAFAGRVCAGLLIEAGFPELVTENLADYENLAVALAGDRMRLAALKTRVRQEAPSSALFDTQGYARDLGRAFREMFERSQAGLPPKAFDVADLA